jgi:uncharacterized repeat protein (TIGR03843 family)
VPSAESAPEFAATGETPARSPDSAASVAARPGSDESVNPTPDRVVLDQAIVDVITMGEIAVTGRLTDASNLTLLGEATLDGLTVPCIYKPVRGERPLWDFPDGTLAERELAAYLVSRSAGWDCVPLTVIRDGPYGPGMVQRWIDDADPEEVVDLVPVGAIPAGWLPVLRAVDTHGDDVAVVHADNPALALLAGFDLVVNNADRKGSHVLPTADGRILGVDHGLCFHTDDKLRTMRWGWAGRPLPAAVLEGIARLRVALDGELGDRLDELITTAEMRALRRRLKTLAGTKKYPRAPGHRTPIPWPPL